MRPIFVMGLMSTVMIWLISQAGREMSNKFSWQEMLSWRLWQKKSVNEIAQEVTVIIESCSSGSGVIFQKDGNTYSVLTARHVVSNEDKAGNDVDCLVITRDGERHTAKANKFKVYEGLDLAVMQFESSKDYQPAELEKSEKATLGQKISIAGAPIPNETITKRTLRVVGDGTIISTPSEGTLGRTLVYSNSTKVGMSGGPVLDEQGRVIGIHTAADPKDGGREAYGVPIQKFLTGKVSQKPKDQNAETYLSKGLALYEKKDYQGAITNYDQAIKLNPYSPAAYLRRGLARYELGDTQGTIADYDKAIKLNPTYAYSYRLRGSARYLLGDKQRGLADLDQAIKLDPNNANTYGLRGTARSELGDKQGAITDYDQAIKLNPNFVDAYFNRSLIHYQLGDKQRALADFDQVIKLNPNDAKFYAFRSTIRVEQLDIQGAIADLDQAIKLNPNYAEAYGHRGLVHYLLGNKQEAIKDLQKTVELFEKQGNQEKSQKIIEILKKLQGQ